MRDFGRIVIEDLDRICEVADDVVEPDAGQTILRFGLEPGLGHHDDRRTRLKHTACEFGVTPGESAQPTRRGWRGSRD